ncbi:MAG: helix-turn-helix domain-containing protein [Bacteroidales bacterium]|nr:helix-turn-helix domain-containing protein [Bacteroidales bacterium]
MQETTLYIKNMVCNHCIKAVEGLMNQLHLHTIRVELGVATIADRLDDEMMQKLRTELKNLGFELLDDKRQQMVSRIKNLIIQLVHYRDGQPSVNLSSYLADELHTDYSALSKLFSEINCMTIERYFILQKVERVKELITYDELSLTQIALKMNYSSVAYLSSQFKQVTGLTPSQFKALRNKNRQSLDKI